MREPWGGDRSSRDMHASQTSSDAAVIRASRLDPAVFGVVFDRHWVRIHRYCVVRAGPPGEDVAAETFRVAFDRRSDYDGRDDAAPWLYGIATNLLRNWFRSASRGERALRRSAGHPVGDELEDALERARVGSKPRPRPLSAANCYTRGPWSFGARHSRTTPWWTR